MERHVDALVSAFSTDFYIDEDAARSAIKSQRMFSLMYLDSAIKDESVDWPYLKDWAPKLGVAAGELPDAALLAFAEWNG
jgi:hypothetical protein